MKCYTLDQLLEFAMAPAKEENAEIAVHLLHCKSCRADYKLAMETVHEMDQETMEEFTSSVASLLKKNNPWQRFYDMIGCIAKELQGSFGFINMKQVMQPCMTFAAAESRGGGFSRTTQETPAITFEAETPDYSDYYWKAQMTFPNMISNHSMIQMKIADKEGRPLRDGTLLFLGQEFRILAGSSNIPFKEFIKEKRGNSIGIRFKDGCQIDGTIKFLPESFS